MSYKLWEDVLNKRIFVAKTKIDAKQMAIAEEAGGLDYGDLDDEDIEQISVEIKPYDPRDADRLYCPDCGCRSLRVIEDTEPDLSGEYKQVCTCDNECCQQIVHVVRHK